MKKNEKMKKEFSKHVALKGSSKTAPTAKSSGKLRPEESVCVTVKLRPRKALPDLLSKKSAGKAKLISRASMDKDYSTTDADVQLIADFATHYGLSIVWADPGQGIIKLRGSVEQMKAAFKVDLLQYTDKDGTKFRGRKGSIYVPKELAKVVEGIFGLDNRPVATPKFQVSGSNGGTTILFAPHTGNTPFNPNQLAGIYNFPAGVKGKGQSIAIIELGGGFRTADITAYFLSLGIPKPNVVAISVDGAHNSPSNANSADGEVMLDIEVAGAIAPQANIVVYFAPNTNQGFFDAISAALHDTTYKPSVISISWGSSEKNWTSQSLSSYNTLFNKAALLGVTVCVASGDAGSNDGVIDGKVHVDFPASSPYALACGGTRLTVNAANQVASEVVWHDSNTSAGGGGVSEVFALPGYQANSGVPLSVSTNKKGRGVPDVAGDADPVTGYNVRVDGQNFVIGGTSAVAPLMAGLIALINQKKGANVGFIHPKLYANPTACRDIILGDNKTVTGNKGYAAKAGWDACTGNGVPDGVKLLNIL